MANPGVYQLFVYGSLRSGFHSSAYEYISRFFTLIGDAKVRGQLYDLGEYPAAIPVKEDSFITGELYAITRENEFSWAMGQLDDYEGVNTEPGEEQLYYRELADVIMNDIVTRAWVYWYKGDVSGSKLISSGDVLEYLKNK
jgi:gamma-glutamylcyclotransferase (GGCT)/AIG2-like uncharacterized protein YtfP